MKLNAVHGGGARRHVSSNIGFTIISNAHLNAICTHVGNNFDWVWDV